MAKQDQDDKDRQERYKEERKREEEEYQAKQAAKAKQRNDAFAAHPEWSQGLKNLISTRHFQIGMSMEQVLLSLGDPDHKNVSVGAWGTYEQWIYGDTYLYFQNGILTSYQQ